MTSDYLATRTLLLLRHGAIYAPAAGGALPESLLQAFEVNMADAGYAVSNALRGRLHASRGRG